MGLYSRGSERCSSLLADVHASREADFTVGLLNFVALTAALGGRVLCIPDFVHQMRPSGIILSLPAVSVYH